MKLCLKNQLKCLHTCSFVDLVCVHACVLEKSLFALFIVLFCFLVYELTFKALSKLIADAILKFFLIFFREK